MSDEQTKWNKFMDEAESDPDHKRMYELMDMLESFGVPYSITSEQEDKLLEVYAERDALKANLAELREAVRSFMFCTNDEGYESADSLQEYYNRHGEVEKLLAEGNCKHCKGKGGHLDVVKNNAAESKWIPCYNCDKEGE